MAFSSSIWPSHRYIFEKENNIDQVNDGVENKLFVINYNS